jgi:chromate reductase
VLIGKPMAMMGAGGRFGTVRAQAHLRYIAVHSNLLVLGKPELMVPAAHEKFDSNGRLTDEHTREQLQALMEALGAWTRRLRVH